MEQKGQKVSTASVVLCWRWCRNWACVKELHQFLLFMFTKADLIILDTKMCELD